MSQLLGLAEEETSQRLEKEKELEHRAKIQKLEVLAIGLTQSQRYVRHSRRLDPPNPPFQGGLCVSPEQIKKIKQGKRI